MKPAQIEARALDVVERAQRHQPIEDARVEVKADWIEPVAAARRIGGLINAARGESVLLIIGVDEKTGTAPGVNAENLANWWPQVATQFDGPAPTSIDVAVPVPDGKTIVAMLFQADRVPCVVKNPNYGKQGGGNIEREVPWREGTAVRSATRADLLKMLVPLVPMPNVEVLSASLYAQRSGRSVGSGQPTDWKVYWRLEIELYVEPSTGERIVVPEHRCTGTLQFSEFGESILSLRQFEVRHPLSGLLTSSGGNAVFGVPGVLTILADGPVTPDGSEKLGGTGSVKLRLGVSQAARPVAVDIPLVRAQDPDPGDALWVNG